MWLFVKLYLVKFQVTDSFFFYGFMLSFSHMLSPIARKFSKEIEHLKRYIIQQ
jgi:hypothetical protein